MSTATVHHAYNDVVASHYDRDPQGVIGRSLDLGVEQLKEAGLFVAGREPARVLDVGMGTGLFLGKLRDQFGDQVIPYGGDLAENMVEIARKRLPDLQGVVGDASKLNTYFAGLDFDCICTHFITGFVPMRVFAPQIASRLKTGGYWSLVGGTKAAYPALQAKGDSKLLRRLSGAGSQTVEEAALNPADLNEVASTMEAHGLEMCAGMTFEPALDFGDFDRFMEFGHRGGWLTPLIESMGLHEAGPLKRWLINKAVFPVQDKHNIVIALGRKR